MKNVLVVDASPVFEEFLKDKFAEDKIEVTFVQDKIDSIPKMISLLPDLVILDINETDDVAFILEYLQKVKADPNASRIPLIAAGPVLDRNEIALFAKFGVQKYFVKPIKFDFFFESIGHILRTAFSMDLTPCMLDIHRNGNIIFIEVAQGLNREKLSILRYKLSEMIEEAELENPKIVIMMTNLDLTFVDGLNLELLLNNVLSNHKIKPSNIKVLSFSDFTRELIDGHNEYSGIECVKDISNVLNSLVDSSSTSHVSDLITDKILTTTDNETGSIEVRFNADANAVQEEFKASEMKTAENSKYNVAIVDDDAVILDIVSGAFRSKGINCVNYSTASEFLRAIVQKKYDLIILDILMPGISGFDTLKRLKDIPGVPPIIVYSQALKREIVIQALTLGAKQYLAKPQKPDVIVSKALEVINANSK